MVSRDQYLEWRKPRIGTANPERMTNPIWTHVFSERMSGYGANSHYGGPSSFGGKPAWSGERFGQSETKLPDGRTLYVGGEHEDYYDPDFFIYNDVIVMAADGSYEFYGYPHEIFPPTDFHSATLVGTRLILIGSLGYVGQRRSKETQVLALDVHTLAISSLSVAGTPPGWIHKHTATLEDGGGIVLTRGLLETEGPGGLVENIDDWRLDLAAMRWERLTERQWPRWELSLEDGKSSNLWNVQHVKWSIENKFGNWEKSRDELAAMLGGMPEFALCDVLYAPPVAFKPLEECERDEFGTTRIEVDGVIVRYVAGTRNMRVTIEGVIAADKAEAIIADLVDKLTKLERRSWVVQRS